MIPDDLLEFGLIPEFVGRLPVACSLDPLTQESLVRILTEPKNALTKQYQRLLHLDKVELVFDDDAIEAAAQEAMQRKTGARGLRTVIEEVLMEVMYDIPSMPKVRKCVITADCIVRKRRPLLLTGAGQEIPAVAPDSAEDGLSRPPQPGFDLPCQVQPLDGPALPIGHRPAIDARAALSEGSQRLHHHQPLAGRPCLPNRLEQRQRLSRALPQLLDGPAPHLVPQRLEGAPRDGKGRERDDGASVDLRGHRLHHVAAHGRPRFDKPPDDVLPHTDGPAGGRRMQG